MQQKEIKTEKRDLFGRKVKTLRKSGNLPANIYGKGFKSKAIQLSAKDFGKLFQESGETTVINLKLKDEDIPVLIHNVQTDPVSDEIIHVDFLKVDLKQKVTADVPVELVGEAPAQKQGLGTVVQYINELEVEALPNDLPEKFEVNISVLAEVDQAIQIKNLDYEKTKVEVKEDPEQIIVKIEPLQKEEEIKPPEVEAVSEVAAEGEKTEEAPTAGEAQPETEEKK